MRMNSHQLMQLICLKMLDRVKSAVVMDKSVYTQTLSSRVFHSENFFKQLVAARLCQSHCECDINQNCRKQLSGLHSIFLGILMFSKIC